MCATYLNKTREVLNYIAARSVVTSSEIAAAKSLLRMYPSGAGSSSPRRRLIDTCGLLARQGFITTGMLDGERVYKLSHKGTQKLQRYQALKVDILPRFDGHWYLVTFDLPESHKSVRNLLIITLKRHGFVSYSGGVWLLPYNPNDLIIALRKQLGIKKEIRLIVATQVDGASDYRRKFGI